MAATLKRGEAAAAAFSSSAEVEEVWVAVELAVWVLEAEPVAEEVWVTVVAEVAAEPKTWAKTRARTAKKRASFICVLIVFGTPGRHKGV